MSERKLTLIDIGPLLLSQYEECVEFKFFKEFKAYELRAEDIPHLFDIIDLLQIHEKDLVRHRQEI